jgi:paraquat-inducible protein B
VTAGCGHSLNESQATMRRLQTTLDNLNKITASQSRFLTQ